MSTSKTSNDARFLRKRNAAQKQLENHVGIRQFMNGEVKPRRIKPEHARKVTENRPLPPNIWNPDAGQLGFGASNTVQGPASILELASSLKNDPDLIYQWVHDNIEFHPTFGTQKGALGTLLDGVGNSFDQSALLIALLSQAGYTANYVFGNIQLTPAQAQNWLNVTDTQYAANLLQSGGIPVSYNANLVWFSHCWVQVQIGGTWYVYDPSFKTYTYQAAGITNIGTAMGYSQSTLMAGADSGATITTNYIQNVNRANVRSQLTTYATSLVSYIKSNLSSAGLDDVLGGRKIVSASIPLRQTANPNEIPNDNAVVWTSVPASYKAAVNIYGYGYNFTLTGDQVSGHRLTAWFDANQNINFYLDGTLLATGNTPGVPQPIWVYVTHPYGGSDINVVQTTTLEAQNQNIFLACFFGPIGRGNVEYHRNLLNAARAAGGSDDSEAVLGEGLAVLALTWPAEWTQLCEIQDRMNGTWTLQHHACNWVSNTNQLGGFSPEVSGRGFTWAWSIPGLQYRTDYATNIMKGGFAEGMVGEIIESLCIATALGTNSMYGGTAVDSANTGSYALYDATSSNFSTAVQPNLINYPSFASNDWNDELNAGGRLLIPAQGALVFDQLTGYGWWNLQTGNVINSMMGFTNKGANGTKNLSNSDFNKGAGSRQPKNLPTGQTPKSDEPIDLSSGSYTYQRTDLSVGSGKYPHSLSFQRYYDSSNRITNTGLGLGWTHNFAITAMQNADAFRGMGSMSAIDAAATIVLLYVFYDLFNGSAASQTSVDKYAAMALAAQWWHDSLANNSVILNFGDHSEIFIALPDGTFNPPPGVAATLTQVSGNYVYKTPQGVTYNFNSNGNLSTIVYPFGVTITCTYTSGVLTSVTNGLGRTLTLGYTGSNLTSVSDGTGRSVGFTIDGNNNLTTFTDALSHSITYAYDIPGRLTQVFLPQNPTVAIVTNTYDTLNRVKTQADAGNNVWHYYLAGSRAEEVDPNSNSTVRYLNQYGRTITQTDAVSKTTTLSWDGNNRLAQTTMPEGNYTTYTYDQNNNVLSVTNVAKSGSGLPNVVNSFTYDPTWRKVKTAVDGLNKTTTFNYDPSTGNLLNVQRPQVGGQTPQVSFTYNTRGQVLTKTDETGIVTKYTYDTSTEKLTSVILDSGTSPHLNLTVSFGYDTVGNVNSITDANGNIRTYQFDAERRPTQKTDPTPFSFITNTTYDLNGNTASIQRATGGTPAWQTTSFAYFPTNNLNTITDPLSYVTTFDYDNRNRPFHLTDAQSRKTTNAYDADSRKSGVTDPSNTVADTRTFTANGMLYQRTDARSKVTTYTYDGFDRLSKIQYADGSTEQYTSYDANGNLLIFKSRAGLTVTNTYDALNRLATKAPQSQAVVTYTYDLAGRLTQVSTPVVSGNPATGAFQYAFDSAGRFYKETAPDGKTTTYQLDSNGNITKVTWPDGYFVTRVYDQLNRLTDVKLNGASTSALHFAYDQLSRRQTLTYGNGAAVTYGFQLNDDATSVAHVFNGTTSLTLTYGYDHTHKETSRSVSDSTYLWHPSAAGTTTYGAADNVNKYPTVGGTTYSYNTNGCLTGNGTWTYGYDTENHLTTASKTGVSASFVYDPQHRQIQKTVGSAKTRFVYAGLQRIADYDGVANTLQNRYVFGVGLDEPLIMVSATGTVTYMHADRHGSIIAMTNSSGSVTSTFKYSPFGESTSAPTSNFGFTGQRFDPETGLYYWRARYFSPAIGRFLQPDPMLTLNRYSYVQNAPLDLSDPLGLAPSGLPSGDLLTLPGGDLFKGGLPFGLAPISSSSAPDLTSLYIPFSRFCPTSNDIQWGQGPAGYAKQEQAKKDAFRNNVFQAAVFGGLAAIIVSLGAGWAIFFLGATGDTAAGLGTASGFAALANQLSQINDAAGSTASYRTYAVTITAEGTQIFSSGGGPLTQAQLALVQEGQLVAPYIPGVHAEAAGLLYAQQQGLTVTAQQATRIMCPGCADAIEQLGGTVAGKSAVLPH